MKFLIKPHQGKEQPYRDALLAAGHVEAKDADVVLIDFESPYPQLEIYAEYARYAQDTGAALISYPHGAALVPQHQMTHTPYPCAASFVHGPGQKNLLEAYDYPNPVQWVGYPPGHRVPIKPREVNHVLFAPIHPLGSGFLPDNAKKANTEAFRTLLDGNYMLTVRVIGSLGQNGIWDEPAVRYIYGQMDGSVDGADVAVATSTYALNSLCKGIPVVMHNQEREWTVELEGEDSKMVPDWVQHENKTRYPYDLGWPSAIEDAAQNVRSTTLSLWMDSFMPPFDAEKFARLVERSCLSSVS